MFSPLLGKTDLTHQPVLLFLVGLSILVLFFWYFATEIERRKRNIGSVLVLGVVVLCFIGLFPPKKSLKGGVDIVGGVAFTLAVDPGLDDEGNPRPVTLDDTQSAITTLRQRLDPQGTKDLTIAAQGTDRIVLQMPGIGEKEATEVRTTIEKTAKLEMREVHPQNATLAQQVKNGTKPAPGYKLYTYTAENSFGEEFTEDILLSRRVAFDGSYIDEAFPDYADGGTVVINLNGEGGKKMENLTRDMTPGRDRIAVVLDGIVKSAPTVQSVPLGSRFTITGLDNTEEAQDLSNVLMNPLQNPLKVEEQRQVSATLGAATVSQGINAGLLGLGLTVLFVLAYYRFAGIVAIIALVINVIVLFGVMAMFEFTFTLPGIAGIVLTIGVAVDANVLIYERLREELSLGKSVKGALNAAFEKAFSAIFDANITTLITALILFWRASDTVKGFAVTLTIGILASMFSALLAVRVMFWWFTAKKDIKKLTFMNLAPKRVIDFLSKRNIAFVLSAVLILGSLGTMAVKNQSALGIDFTGGSLIRFTVGEDKRVEASEADRVLESANLGKGFFVQEETIVGSGELLTVRVATDDAEKAQSALQEAIPALAEAPVSVDAISSSLGAEFLSNSLLALGLGLLAIIIYITIRFEFSFALGAFVAIFHDLIISIGIVLLLGTELSLIHVGAFLTIAGYSINDTIIVFDRIRESLQTARGTTKEIMNEAINATLSRTILTSATTLVTVICLYLLGGAGLRDFSLAIIIGIIVGTYSSIFIASPIVYIWAKINGTNLRQEVLPPQIQDDIEGAELPSES